MLENAGESPVALVAACTAEAAHRRDHHHTATPVCHPHAVEVVHLGRRAMTVCHDCQTDSGFLPEHEADVVAQTHRDQTLHHDNDLAPPAVA